MFSRVIPSKEQIGQFKQPLTEGEWYLLNFLDAHLKKDDLFQGNDPTKYNGWLIFVQPFLNGSRPDIVIFHPNIGVQIFEVKDWNLAHYSFEPKKNGDRGYNFCVSDSRGTYIKKSPIKQVEHYKEKIVGLLLPQIGEKIDDNNQYYGIIKTAVYFHKSTTAQAQKLFSSSSKDFSKSPVIGHDALSKDNIKNVVPDSYLRQSKYWQSCWNEELLFWLSPPFHVIEQSTPLKLTHDQIKFAEPLVGHHRVRGVAGSGKTHVLAYRASKLASQDCRVLVLTFNLTLCHLIRDMVKRSPFAFHWQNLTVTYFHGFCKDVLNHFGEVWPKHDDEDESVFREVVPNTVVNTIIGEEYEKYDAILIDEGQDFCVEWYNMLCLFLTERDEVVVVCDKKQNIYGRTMEWLDKRVGKRIDKKSQLEKFDEWIELKKVIRLPEQVAKISVAFSENFSLNQDLRSDNFVRRDLFNQLIDHIVWWNVENDWLEKVDKAFEMIKSQATYKHPSDTAILLPDKYIGLRCVHYFESKKKILVNHVFEDDDEKKYHKHKKAFWMGDSRLKMSTIHSFKGWEVPNVIVVIPFLIHGSEELYDMCVYTAITRSKENLIIINANARYREFGEKVPNEWE